MPPVSSRASTVHLPLSVVPTRAWATEAARSSPSSVTAAQDCDGSQAASRAPIAQQPLVTRSGGDVAALDELERQGRKQGVRPPGVVVAVVLPGRSRCSRARVDGRTAPQQAEGEVVDHEERAASAKGADEGRGGAGGIVE